MKVIYKLVAKRFPDLRMKLAQARMSESPENYIKRTIFISLLLAIAVTIIVFFFTKNLNTLLAFPIFYAGAFLYFMNYVYLIITKRNKEISREIVFAGRSLIIELESGVPVYEAFQSIAANYDVVGRYFAEVLERVDLGTPLEESLNEAVQLAPSNDLRRMLWQVLNSLKTGSEVADALNNVFDQIVREQQISVKEYGRKLNPMAMFYMMVAIIIPSLGTIMIIVLSTFIGLELNSLFFTIIVVLNILVQLMFVAIIKSQRPPVEI